MPQSDPTRPKLVGIHHARVPVDDVLAARDWLVDTFGFGPVLLEEDEDRVTGAVVDHPSGIVLGLHYSVQHSSFLSVSIGVIDVAEWDNYLASVGCRRGPIQRHQLGSSLMVLGPGGVVLELHTLDQPSEDEA